MPKREPAPSCLILGRLHRDTILTSDGSARIDQMGGNLLQAAGACIPAGVRPGLVARVGSDYPSEWLEALKQHELDTRGLQVAQEPLDVRRFIAYSDSYTAHFDHPIKYFAERGQPFPKELLDYAGDTPAPDSKRERTALTLRPEDIPKAYRGAKAAHLCSLDYLSHSLMPAALRDAGVRQITLEGGQGYMHAGFWREFPDLVNGLSAFITTEAQMGAMFTRHSGDLWEMMLATTSFNCLGVVVLDAARGNRLYDATSSTRYHLPPFPARTYDITDCGSSFGGAFAVELERSQDLVVALVAGSASASVAVEGSGPFYLADTFPGLIEARKEVLQQALKIV